MVASPTHSLEMLPTSVLADGVFGNDPWLLGLVLEARLDRPVPYGKSAGDDILDAIHRAQATDWE